jgi:hypothetical protein
MREALRAGQAVAASEASAVATTSTAMRAQGMGKPMLALSKQGRSETAGRW